MDYQVYARKVIKNHISFFNLLHNFVCVGVYQLKRFVNNFVNILDRIKKKLNLILQCSIRVPRNLIKWAMRKKELPEVIIRVVMSLYNQAKAKVRVEFSQKFLVQVGVHQESVLSSLLFTIAVDVILENAREGLMNEILHQVTWF